MAKSAWRTSLFADTITADGILLASDPLGSGSPSFGLKYRRIDILTVTKAIDRATDREIVVAIVRPLQMRL